LQRDVIVEIQSHGRPHIYMLTSIGERSQDLPQLIHNFGVPDFFFTITIQADDKDKKD